MLATTFDAERVRTHFPALDGDLVLLDSPGGTQLPKSVSDAIGAAMTTAVSNQSGAYPASARADEIVLEARRAIADLIGADPSGVVLGPAMTALTYRMAGALAAQWRPGDNIVVSRLDHDANVRPWVQAATRAGAEVRWAAVDPVSCELPADQYAQLVDARTRLVAVSGASNVVGTRPAVERIAAIAHASGALVYVDGVHLTAHAPVDMVALGADFYATSAYKWCGPHLAAVAASPALLETLRPDKLLPATDRVPQRFELGTLPFESLAGVPAAVEFLAGLAAPTAVSRRERVLASLEVVEQYEEQLASLLREGLRALGARVIGAPARHTPTVAFVVPGWEPRALAAALGERGIGVGDGEFFALELIRSLGLPEEHGVVRAGFAPYNTVHDVERTLDALRSLI